MLTHAYPLDLPVSPAVAVCCWVMITSSCLVPIAAQLIRSDAPTFNVGSSSFSSATGCCHIDVMQLQQENAAQLLPSAPKRTGPARRTRRAVLLETVAEEAADLDTPEASPTKDPPAGVSCAE